MKFPIVDVLRFEMTMHCRHIRPESFTSPKFQDHSGAEKRRLCWCLLLQAIASALMVNRSVKVINLEGNNIGVLGAKAAWDAQGGKCCCTAWEGVEQQQQADKGARELNY